MIFMFNKPKIINMSINYNKAKTKKCSSKKEYNNQQLRMSYPPYWDECMRFYSKLNNRWAKPSNKQILSYQVRMYKTWKHNRKTQWK